MSTNQQLGELLSLLENSYTSKDTQSVLEITKSINKNPGIPKIRTRSIKRIQTRNKPYTKARPAYAKGQIEKVWNSAKQKNGKVYDPYTGEELHWDMNEKRLWDMGHKPGKEYKKVHKEYIDGEISKDEFLKEYRNADNYQPQSRKTNRSRKYEEQ